MVEVTGLEPVLPESKSDVLPLHNTSMLLRDSLPPYIEVHYHPKQLKYKNTFSSQLGSQSTFIAQFLC